MEKSFYIKKRNIIDNKKERFYTIIDSLTEYCFIEVNMVAYERILKLKKLNIKINICLNQLEFYYSNRIPMHDMISSSYAYSNISFGVKCTNGFIIEPVIMT